MDGPICMSPVRQARPEKKQVETKTTQSEPSMSFPSSSFIHVGGGGLVWFRRSWCVGGVGSSRRKTRRIVKHAACTTPDTFAGGVPCSSTNAVMALRPSSLFPIYESDAPRRCSNIGWEGGWKNRRREGRTICNAAARTLHHAWMAWRCAPPLLVGPFYSVRLRKRGKVAEFSLLVRRMASCDLRAADTA